MTRQTNFRACLVLGASLAVSVSGAAMDTLEYETQELDVNGRIEKVTVPAGYRLEVLTEALDGPRMLTFGPRGDLFIGSRSGRIYRLAAPYRSPHTLVRVRDYPHSVAIRGEEMLIARPDGLYRAPYRPGQEKIRESSIELLEKLPSGGGHSSRTVRIGPDGRVYLGIGISGNCPNEYLDSSYPFSDRRGGILVLEEAPGKTGWQVFASGLRNPIGFDWHPKTGELYASNNGPDHLGYEQPPEYFSRIETGSFHGMPWFQFNGSRVVPDPCIDSKPPRPQRDVVVPVVTFPARNAPFAVSFVHQGQMDKRLEGDAVVALHVSWATKPAGGFLGAKSTRRVPKIVVVRFRDGIAQRVDDLVTGFQRRDGTRWARPAGVATGPDGALYFTSDGGANALFRLGRNP